MRSKNVTKKVGRNVRRSAAEATAEMAEVANDHEKGDDDKVVVDESTAMAANDCRLNETLPDHSRFWPFCPKTLPRRPSAPTVRPLSSPLALFRRPLSDAIAAPKTDQLSICVIRSTSKHLPKA